MATLTVTSRGRVTLSTELMSHLRVAPGDKLDMTLMPGGMVLVKAARPKKTIGDIFGMLADKTSKVATLEEIAAASGPYEKPA